MEVLFTMRLMDVAEMQVFLCILGKALLPKRKKKKTEKNTLELASLLLHVKTAI